MLNNYHPDFLLEIGKARVREFHREREAINLAQKAQNLQQEPVKTPVNPVGYLFKPLILKMAKRFGFGRILWEKAVAISVEPPCDPTV